MASFFNVLNRDLERRERRLQALEDDQRLIEVTRHQGETIPQDITRQQQQGLLDPLWLSDQQHNPDLDEWAISADAPAEPSSFPGTGTESESSPGGSIPGKWWQRFSSRKPRLHDETYQFLQAVAPQDGIAEQPTGVDTPISDKEIPIQSQPLGASGTNQSPKVPGFRNRGQQKPTDFDYFETLAQDEQDPPEAPELPSSTSNGPVSKG